MPDKAKCCVTKVFLTDGCHRIDALAGLLADLVNSWQKILKQYKESKAASNSILRWLKVVNKTTWVSISEALHLCLGTRWTWSARVHRHTWIYGKPHTFPFALVGQATPVIGASGRAANEPDWMLDNSHLLTFSSCCHGTGHQNPPQTKTSPC